MDVGAVVPAHDGLVERIVGHLLNDVSEKVPARAATFLYVIPTSARLRRTGNEQEVLPWTT